MHCYENVIEELEECYELDPESIIFYIPQLVTYFLYSAYQNSSELEAFLLDKCSRNIHFSHRMFWFLRAWCVGKDSTPAKEGKAILDLMRKVKRSGEGPASLLMVGQGPGEDINALVRATEGAIGGSGASSNGYQSGGGSHNHHHHNQSNNHNHYRSPTQSLQPSLDLTLLPTTSSGPNPRHEECIKTFHRIGFFPISSLKWGSEDCFLGAINFIEALVGIADELFEVPKGERTAQLRNLLRVLEVEMLPSNVTYIPIGNQRHRVWR